MKKGIYNIIFGLVSQITTVLIGIILPKLIVQQYGSEVNGLLSSVGQIYVYLALFEAGVGTATMQALYKPIAQENHDGVNGILAATNTYFKKTGVLYGITLAACALIYPVFVRSDISYLNIVWIIVLAGAGSVLNYLFYGKYRIFLEASGNSYIVNNVVTASYLIISIGKIVLISNGVSILFVQSMQLLYYILQMLGICFFTKKKYGWISVKGERDYKAISQKNSVMVHQISSLIFANTDVLILTFFSGLKLVSVYTMYNYLFSTLMTLILTVVNSIIYVLGRVYFESREKYLRYHEAFQVLYLGIGSILFSVLYVCVIPFMRLYMAGVTDANYIDPLLPVFFLAMQFLNIMRGPENNLINIAGHFSKTQNRAIIEMSINLIASIICVTIWGIYGVLLGTICALLYRSNDIVIYANHKILERSALPSYKRIVVNLCGCVAVVLFYRGITFIPKDYLNLIVYAVKNGIVIAAFFIVINVLADLKNVKSVIGLMLKRDGYE